MAINACMASFSALRLPASLMKLLYLVFVFFLLDSTSVCYCFA